MKAWPYLVPGLLAAALNAQAQGVSNARAECEALARAALPVAQQMLRLQGEFPPYGVGLTAGKETVLVPEDERDRLQADDRLGALRASLAKAMRSRRLRATALVYEARLTLPSSEMRSDAIAVSLNHRHGYSALVVYPYQFANDELKLGEAHVIEQKEPPRTSSAKRRK